MTATAPSTRIALCGSLRVELDGRRVEHLLPGHKGRLLVAYLALNRQRAVPRDELIDRLWPDNSPASPEATLNVALSRARSVLGAGTLHGRGPVRLGLPEPVWVDVEAAETCRARVEAAGEADQLRRLTEARAGLDLLAAPVLDGSDAGWIDEVRARMGTVTETLLEALARSALLLGGAYLAEGERAAVALLARNDVRQLSAALLMELHERRGDLAAAIVVFNTLRGRLREEFGMVPSTEIRALYERLLEDSERPNPPPRAPVRPRVELPAIARSGEQFVGRLGELERLHATWKRVLGRETELVLLTGEPGVGKSRLAARFMHDAHAGGATVLYGRSDEDAPLPYQPVAEALADYFQYRHHAADVEGLTVELSTLSRLLPELATYVPGLPPPFSGEAEVERARLFQAVEAVFSRMTDEAPVLLVLDDLHWADRATLVLLRNLLRRLRALPVLVLITYRHGELQPAHPLREWIASVHSHLSPVRLDLAGLDETEAADLVELQSGRPAGEQFVRRLCRDTSGNPFFMREILRALGEAGDAEELSPEALVRLGVPRDVNDVILPRVERLGPEISETLHAAAVCGATFRRSVVADALGRSGADVLRALDEAARTRLIVELSDGPPGRFAFCHAIVRSALYGDLLADRRVDLHAAYAKVLTANRMPAGEIFHHCVEAQDRIEPALLATAAVAAAKAESATLAYERAEATLLHALALLDEMGGPEADPLRCQLLLVLGRTQWRGGLAGAGDTFRRAAAIARNLGDGESLAWAALGLAGRYWDAALIQGRELELLEEALAWLGDSDSEVRARVLARLGEVLHFHNQTERSRTLTRQALDLAKDPYARLAALMGREVSLLDISDLDERLEVGAQLVEAARALGRREALVRGLHWRTVDLIQAGDIDAAKRSQAEHAAVAAELGQPLLDSMTRSWESTWALLAGRDEEAEVKAREAYDYNRRAKSLDADSLFNIQLLGIRHQQGRLAEMSEDVNRMVAQYRGIVAWRTVVPLAYAVVGRRDQGRAALAEFTGARMLRLPRNLYRIGALAYLADACARLEDADAAESLYPELLPHRTRFVTVSFATVLGSVEYYLGLLAEAAGRPGTAREHFAAGAEANERIGAPAMAARSRAAA